MKHLTFYIWTFVFLLLTSSAQVYSQELADVKNESNLAYTPQHGLGLGLGMKGITIGYTYQWSQPWAARAEVGGLLLPNLNSQVNLSGQELSVTGDIEVLTSSLLIDFYPWKSSSWRLFAGIGYTFTQQLSGRAVYANAISYGELSFEGEEVGYVDVAITTQPWMPQMGLAWGRTIPQKRWGVSVALGSYWWGAPKVRLAATRMLANTTKEQDKLQNNLSGYQWWPFMQIGLNFRL